MKIVFLCIALSFALIGCEPEAAATPGPSQSLSVVTSAGIRHNFNVELALTGAQQRKGLMNRTEMAADAGMLFFFGDEDERSFWMKNTLIPLDIIFIKKDGTILNIHENAVPHDLTSVKSEGPAAAALELNGGRAAELGIKPGDKIHHLLFNNALK